MVEASAPSFAAVPALQAKNLGTADGKIKTVREFVAPHLPAYEFASEVCRLLVAPMTQGRRRNIVAVYLDPSNFKHIGDGQTIVNQINEALEPYDIGCIPASNDRIGGWQLMYQMLQTGQCKAISIERRMKKKFSRPNPLKRAS